MIPGEYMLKQEVIACNVGRQTVSIAVINTGDRPVQVGSHFHFFEVNKQMRFDREKAFGMRLNIAAGKTVRDGMTQSATATREEGVLDFVIIGAIVIDHWGIVKGDIGIKDGRIVGIGKAGNPDTMDGVTENMVIGAATEV